MSNFPCPYKGDVGKGVCGAPTRYVAFSGGNEYVCEKGHDGTYPQTGEGLPRATLLRTVEGTKALREAMRAHLDATVWENEPRD